MRTKALSVARVLLWGMILAVVFASVPTMIAPDVLVRLDHPIDETDARLRLFYGLVLPVVRTYELIGDSGGYRYLIDPPDMANYSPRPSSMALGHLLRAVPFWFVTLNCAVFCARAVVHALRSRVRPDSRT